MMNLDMPVYYFKRAFDILREERFLKLIQRSFEMTYKNYRYAKRRIFIRFRHFLMKRRYDAVADPYKIINVDPDKITKYLTSPRPSWYDSKYSTYGLIQDGNWDIEYAGSFNEKKNYQAMKSHFLENVSWEESGMEANRSSKELSEYHQGIDELYSVIKTEGYEKKRRKKHIDPRDYNVVSVHIDRDGRFIFAGSGFHRLSIAKILELEQIPVRVLARHKQWQEIMDDIYNNGLSEKHKELREHPDLQDILD